MIEPGQVTSHLPELDRIDDPRGGAVAWALLAVAMAVVTGIILALMWLAGI
jgi:hypothetical protein